MPTFSAKPLNPASTTRISNKLRAKPFLFFGLPFLTLVVISSFALEGFTRTRYDLHDQKVQSVSKEQELGMKKDRKKIDIREEYYRLNAIPSSSDSSLDANLPALSSDSTDAQSRRKPKFSMAPTSRDELENVRVPRPSGMPEWGPPKVTEGDAPVKGHRKEDRWV